jgi:hypothetical protein
MNTAAPSLVPLSAMNPFAPQGALSAASGIHLEIVRKHGYALVQKNPL